MKISNQIKFKETEIGTIPEEWDAICLEELVNFSNGRTSPVRFDEGKYPVYGANGIIGFSDRTNSSKKSIIIGRVGAYCGSIYFSNNESWVTDNAIKGNAKENTESCFLYYLLNTLGLNERAGGSGQPLINQSILNSIVVNKPPLAEQKQIAEILSSLDDKIELNRQINASLEKIASSLFKHWFIDFEFPDKNGKPYKSSGGKMIDSELGEIPEGWKGDKLSDISDITIGRTPPRMQKQWFSENPQDVKWISIRDLGISGIYINKTAEYLTKEAVERFNIPTISKNTVILSFKLTVGRVAITTEDMLSNEAIAHIKLSDKNISQEYIYLMLKKFDFTSLGTTSSIATAVNSKSIKDMPILIPEDNIIKNFTNTIKPLFEYIYNNTIQIDDLTQVRDSLLPRLMNGKIRVK